MKKPMSYSYCPLCGSEIAQTGEKRSENKCDVCGAKEYRIPGLGLLVGYLYPAEYRKFKVLILIISFLLIAAILFWYISEWKIHQIANPILGLWMPWLEAFYATL